MLRIILIGFILLSVNIVADNHLGDIVDKTRIKQNIKNYRRYRNFNNNRYRPITNYIQEEYIEDRDYGCYRRRYRYRYIGDDYYRGYSPPYRGRDFFHNSFFNNDIRDRGYRRGRGRRRDRGRIIYYRFSNKKSKKGKRNIKNSNTK